MAALFKANPNDMLQKVEQQANELKEARRLIQQYKDKESAGGADEMLKKAAEVGGLHVVTCSQTDCDAAKLRQIGDVLRDKDSAVVAVMAAVNGEKITFQCVCGKDAVAKGVKAGDIIKLHHRHRRRQGRRQAGFRHGRRQRREQAGRGAWRGEGFRCAEKSKEDIHERSQLPVLQNH